eukprot:Hpha_TRINITY_DN2556_c0_g1::TRINITY_DN2556_c0_g1_i2::g.1418::m.1418
MVRQVTVEQCVRTSRVIKAELRVEVDGRTVKHLVTRYEAKSEATVELKDGEELVEEGAGAVEEEERSLLPLEVLGLWSRGAISADDAEVLLCIPRLPPGSWQQVFDDICAEKRAWPWAEKKPLLRTN